MNTAGNSPLETLIQFSFLVVCICMGCGAFFFYNEREKVHPRYRLALLLSTLVTGIACVMYYYMKDKYVPSHVFPTEIRYVDWIVTTPLLLVEFAVLLDFKDRAGIILRLVVWDALMIITGFLGETMGFQIGGFQMRWVMFVVGCGGWLGIVVYLYTGIRKQADLSDLETRRCIVTMTRFVTLGWLIYPVGYVVRATNPELGDWCQLVYNIGDAVNKVGFGILVYAAGMAALQASQSQSQANGVGAPLTETAAQSA